MIEFVNNTTVIKTMENTVCITVSARCVYAHLIYKENYY